MLRYTSTAAILYGATFDPLNFNLGGGNTVPFATWRRHVDQRYIDHLRLALQHQEWQFDLRRKLIFHYALFANSQLATNVCDSSGSPPKCPANDLYITLGRCGFNTGNASSTNQLINGQASTLMHEFGHNLGLLHGGNVDVNFKPNHYSIMNYLYQFSGLSATPNGARAAERYLLRLQPQRHHALRS